MVAGVLLTGNAFAETKSIYRPDDLVLARKDVSISRANASRDGALGHQPLPRPELLVIGHTARVAVNPLLIANIKKWFNTAPEVLKQKIWKPRVDVFVINEVDELHLLQAHSSALVSGFDRLRGFAQSGNYRVPTIVLIQPKMLKISLESQQITIIHEMMHVYDYFLDHKSNSNEFVSAFNADVAGINKWLLSNATDKALYKYSAYAAFKPREAFAEAGARLIRHPRFPLDHFFTLFPRVTNYVQGLLSKDRII
jgi:hypothetical protein